MQFDEESPWTGNARAIDMGTNAGFLSIYIDKAGFLTEFMRKQKMIVRYTNRVVANLSLRGSYAAGQEMVACQTRVNEIMSAKSGPTSAVWRLPRREIRGFAGVSLGAAGLWC